MKHIEITRHPGIKRLLVGRWPQFIIRAITLSGFIFTILAGLLGTNVGSHNFAVIFVWIAWWTALKLVFIPFGGRSWCSICPIPLPGEWLQFGGIIERKKRSVGLHKRWPRLLRGSWLQSSGFLLVGIFGAVTLTSARLTGWILLVIFLLAFVLSLVFDRRAFCGYLCPIGGFSGLYARLAPLELRVKDKLVCQGHKDKTCYENCPWGIYPPALKSNDACGLCMECLRACPYDNVAVNLRSFGSELGSEGRMGYDDVFLGLVMLSSAVIDAILFLGPWGQIKISAFTVGSPAWFLFALSFLAFSMIVFPVFYLFTVWIGWKVGRSAKPLKQAVQTQGQMLVPMGLSAWIAFTISFALAKFRYVLPVVSDPFGWGWNLLNISPVPTALQHAGIAALLPALVLLLGFLWTVRTAGKLSRPGQSLPVLGFCGLFMAGMLWLLIG
jgi:NAD-dependent dihydropyrimidine dehydrogenase PreA subunit